MTREDAEPVRVSLRISAQEYRELVAYAAYLRKKDAGNPEGVSPHSPLRDLWNDFWTDLPEATKRKVRAQPEYKDPERRMRTGGRPRTRTGNEVQLSVEFPREDYAHFAGFSEFRKSRARAEGRPVSHESQRIRLLAIWREFYESLPRKVKREISEGDTYNELMESEQ